MNAAPNAVAPETIVYRQQLALHILSKHPYLSIHHANRIRKLHPVLPPLTPISCPKCENVSLHGRGSVRVVRQAIIKECYVCGTTNSVPRPESRTRASFQSVRVARKKSNFGRQLPTADRAVGNVNIEPLIPVEPLTAAGRDDPQPRATIQPKDSLVVRPVPKGPASANKRQKARGGLQGMLQRNREREAREARDKSVNSNSLNTFLQRL